jgi:hypothetical protein
VSAVQVAREFGELLSQNELAELIVEIVLIYSHQAEEAALVPIEHYLLLFGCLARSGMLAKLEDPRSDSQTVRRYWNIPPGLREQGE